IFRNIFGWSATRTVFFFEFFYDDLHDIYVEDMYDLGVKEYFERVNPAALQEMTATMLESARKGFWKPSDEQLATTAKIHSEITANHGAPCTEFVCGNKKLQDYIARHLNKESAERYNKDMAAAVSESSGARVLKEESRSLLSPTSDNTASIYVVLSVIIFLAFLVIGLWLKKRKDKI
ncbi:MAG: cobaltochelatase subunit CobN, partial [Muribaculaceae bacterium]|nr:cobaltochelatase subunit CobN [Muribaculaceae bacterium]